MAQHDYNIANAGGAAVRADLNTAFDAIKTINSGTTAPTVTAPFMLWYDTAASVLKIRNLADTAWVSFLDSSAQVLLNHAGGSVVASSLNGGQLAGLRNRIQNGNFGINQRVVSGTVTLAAGAYGHDRWRAGASGCTYTFATSANVTTLTISAGSLQQVIEGVNLETGTYCLSWAGTATGKIGAGSLSASGVTGSITGGTNTTIEFSTGTLAKVQLEIGSTATPFEQRPLGVELALCQRYFEKSYDLATAPGSVTGVGQAAFYFGGPAGQVNAGIAIFFKTRKRAIPTITTYSNTTGTTGKMYDATGAVDVNSTVDSAGQSGFRAYATYAATTVTNLQYQWTATADL